MERQLDGRSRARRLVDDDTWAEVLRIYWEKASPDSHARVETIETALALLKGNQNMAAAQIAVPGSIYQPPASGEGVMVINGRPTAFTPFNRVLPNYFTTVGTPILTGRDFDDRDHPGSPPVAIVNRGPQCVQFRNG